MIDLHLNGHADEVLDDLKRLFPHLLAGTSLPPMQEQPKENRDPAPAEPPKQRKPRGAKTEDHGKDVKEELPPENIKDLGAAKQEVASSQSDPSLKESSSESTSSLPSGSDDIPDIELVRARLKTLAFTDGYGHDKVFEVLKKYACTNASGVKPERRAELIAEIDGLLAAKAA